MTHTVVHFTDSPTFGGSEQASLILLTGLDRRRWTPVLVHHPDPGLTPLVAAARKHGIQTWTVPRMRGKSGLRHLPGFVRTVRAIRPAVFHAHLIQPLACMYPRLGAMLARVPAIIATEHLFVDVPWRRSVQVEQWLAKRMDRYIAVSHAMARQLRESLALPADKLQVVHNGIPLSPVYRVSQPDHDRHLINGRHGPIVLTVARLHPQKGLRYLIAAAARVPQATFVLAGDGPERRALETQVAELGLGERVIFLGHRQDIPHLLAGCDLFVLPSLFEGLPLSILEAMAAGKPVIATAVGGTGEAVTHGVTGLLVPASDPAALAEAIQTLLADPSRARRLAAAGQVRVQQEFSAETMVQRVTHIYTEILAERRVAYD